MESTRFPAIFSETLYDKVQKSESLFYKGLKFEANFKSSLNSFCDARLDETTCNTTLYQVARHQKFKMAPQKSELDMPPLDEENRNKVREMNVVFRISSLKATQIKIYVIAVESSTFNCKKDSAAGWTRLCKILIERV